MIKSKQLVESLRNTTIVFFDKFTQILNTSITTACSNLWRNEMKNGSYQHHINWKKEVWPKLPLVLTSRHSMSLFVACFTTRCHSLYHLLSLVVIRYHSLSFDVPLVCLFINDHFRLFFPIQKSSKKFKTLTP